MVPERTTPLCFSASKTPTFPSPQRLADQGIYPGVEYRILEVLVFPTAPTAPTPPTGDSSTTSSDSAAAVAPSSSPQPEQQQHQQEQQPDLDAEPTAVLASARDAPPDSFDDGSLVFTMRPIYPLVARLERGDWPVRVPAREFPVMLTPFSYNAATAWAAFTTSLSLLSVGFVLSQALTLSVINSHSMEPTLQVCLFDYILLLLRLSVWRAVGARRPMLKGLCFLLDLDAVGSFQMKHIS